MRLNCIRTNLATNGQRLTEVHHATLCKNSIGWWVKLDPGVTGYESAQVDNVLKTPGKGWSACAGTPDRWDSLWVPEAEMDRLRDFLALIKPLLDTI